MEIGGGVFDMQTFDEWAGADEVYYYMTTGDGVEKDGWYEEDGETFATKVFNRGEGFMINNSIGAEAGVQFAGQVASEKVTVPIREFYSLMGNIRAVEISIQDIVPESESAEIGGGVFDMQTFDEWAGGDEVYYYMTTGDGVEKDGWYEEDGETFATRKFAPAEGFMINNSTGDKAAVSFKELSL